jgi:hypothetical protein
MKIIFTLIMAMLLFTHKTFAAVNPQQKIKRVTIYSDRAKVEKSAKFAITGDGDWVVLGPLPDQVDKKSISVESSKGGGQIQQMLVTRSFEKSIQAPYLNKRLLELENLYAQRMELLQQRHIARLGHRFVSDLSFKIPIPVENEEFPLFSAQASQLNNVMSEIDELWMGSYRQVQNTEDDLRANLDSINLITAELNRFSDVSKQKWAYYVHTYMPKGSGELELSYFIPQAKWYPSYDLRAQLDRNKGIATIDVVMNALVEQHTQEDWRQVKAKFSSLDPVNLFLPKLDRWVFKEHRQELDRAEQVVASGLAMPMRARQATEKMLQKKSFKMEKANMAMESDAPQAPAAMNRLAMPVDEIAESDSKQGRADVGKNNYLAQTADKPFFLARLNDVFNQLRPLQQQLSDSKEQTPLSQTILADEPQYRANTYQDSKLPAVQSGGRQFIFESPFLLDLDSDAATSKIFLATGTLEGAIDYFVIPKKDKRVFLRATVDNKLPYPLLMGSAQIFMNQDLVMKTDLATVAKGARFKLNLGIDDNVASERTVKKKSSKEGLVFKQHSTEVEVVVQIANRHSFPINIELQDNYPLSNKTEIKVELISVTPQADQKQKGLLKWTGKIEARNKKEYVFKYRVIHPEKYLVSEFN